MQPLLPSSWQHLPLADIALLTPLERLRWPLAAAAGVEVWVKREDLLHPYVGGNKFYKLHGHLQRLCEGGCTRLLTFGGAYSNHICATAALGEMLRLATIGVIRGAAPAELNPTLQRAQTQGMALHFVTRDAYRQKHTASFQQALTARFGDAYCVPEGGGDALGSAGVRVWAQAALKQMPAPPTHIAVAAGTGGTLAGVLAAAAGETSVLGFLALKGRPAETDGFYRRVLALAREVAGINSKDDDKSARCLLQTNYSFGGYGKFPRELQAFVADFEQQTGLPVDRVYTAKLFAGLAADITEQRIGSGSRVLVMHTGGLQAAR